MKKFVCLLLIILTSLVTLACNEENLSSKAIEQGKLAMANKEYDKALSSFDLALSEGTNDTEAREMYDIIKKFKEAQEYMDREDFEKADKTLESISSNYTRYAIREDVDELKSALEENEQVEVTNEGEKVDVKQTKEKKQPEQKPESSKDEVKKEEPKPTPVPEKKPEPKEEVKSRKDEYIRKMDSLEQNFRDMNYIYTDGSNEEIYQAEYENYQAWDKLLNEIWEVLKTQLPKAEMDEVVKIQRQWIKNKENAAETDEREYGYDDEGIVYMSTLGQLTKERCYELVNLYMK